MVWTREEDIRHDIYRPVYRDLALGAALDGRQDRRLEAQDHRLVGDGALAARRASRRASTPTRVDGASDMPYDIPNFRVEFISRRAAGRATGFWRGVGPNNNVFAIESFIDELARQGRQGPGRLPPRPSRQDAAACKRRSISSREKSGWGAAAAGARADAASAAQPSFGSFIATVVEAEVDEDGEVRLRRVTLARSTPASRSIPIRSWRSCRAA